SNLQQRPLLRCVVAVRLRADDRDVQLAVVAKRHGGRLFESEDLSRLYSLPAAGFGAVEPVQAAVAGGHPSEIESIELLRLGAVGQAGDVVQDGLQVEDLLAGLGAIEREQADLWDVDFLYLTDYDEPIRS